MEAPVSPEEQRQAILSMWILQLYKAGILPLDQDPDRDAILDAFNSDLAAMWQGYEQAMAEKKRASQIVIAN